MLIECLIRREGNTPVQLEKTSYTFTPVPDPKRKKGEPSTSICEITSPEHIAYLLKQKGTFREYQEGQPEYPSAVKTINLSGYSIVKHLDGRIEGYRVENANVSPRKYAGSNMTWASDTKGLVPFGSEFEAFQWLREEVEFNSAAPESPEEIESLSMKKELKELGVKVNSRWGIATLREELAKAREKK